MTLRAAVRLAWSPLLPPELWERVITTLPLADLGRAGRVCRPWRTATAPELVIRRAVHDVVDDLLCEIEVDLWEYEPIQHPGECVGCGRRGEAGTQCPSCGGPIDPEDDSYHYYYGEWLTGPRPGY